MTVFNIFRNHSIKFLEMRKIAFTWAEYAEEEYKMNCIYEEGDMEDLVRFSKPGANGILLISHHILRINVRLGALLSPFKKNIEQQIVKKIDFLLLN